MKYDRYSNGIVRYGSNGPVAISNHRCGNIYGGKSNAGFYAMLFIILTTVGTALSIVL